MSRIKFHRSWVLFVTLFAFQLSSSAPTIAQQAPAWAPNTAYAIGARVTYQGVLYQCRQAHTSLVTWEPPNKPALWLVVTGGGGGGDTQAPSAPTNLRVTGLTASSLSLAWNASSVTQLKSEGKKVLLSIGGANGLVELPDRFTNFGFSRRIRPALNSLP